MKGWVKPEWKQTPTKRRARYYALTPAGRRQLAHEVSAFDQLVAAMRSVLRPT